MSEKITDISKFITENFGANSSYVEGLYARYAADPNSVDETWRVYFGDLIAGSDTDTGATSKAVATAPAQPAKSETKSAPETKVSGETEAIAITGVSKKIVENMEISLTVPTATSFRNMPVKVLAENRTLINEHLAMQGRGKVSYTHIIAWAIIQAAKTFPQMNNGFGVVDDKPSRLERESVNLGIAIDIEKKDGSRNLLVPNIKGSNHMTFAEFFAAYNEQVKKARDGKLTLDDFQNTTISLTNPGTIGTIASNPRLMSGQGTIIATGAIDYPAEYQAMTAGALSQLGISKIVTITSTYDHRVIQGAESGLFLSKMNDLLIGKDDFYDNILRDLDINYPPLRWAEDHNPSLLGGDHYAEQAEKQANVLQLINAYRVRGHLLADIDPLNMTEHHASELELETFGLTIWDLDREFITGGLHGERIATLRRILRDITPCILRKSRNGISPYSG